MPLICMACGIYRNCHPYGRRFLPYPPYPPHVVRTCQPYVFYCEPCIDWWEAHKRWWQLWDVLCVNGKRRPSGSSRRRWRRRASRRSSNMSQVMRRENLGMAIGSYLGLAIYSLPHYDQVPYHRLAALALTIRGQQLLDAVGDTLSQDE